MATLAKNERRAVVVELAEVMKHERHIAVSAALAASTGGADPTGTDFLQCVAAEDATAVAALFASGPRLWRVLEAASRSDRDVRAVRCTADAGGSSDSHIFAAVGAVAASAVFAWATSGVGVRGPRKRSDALDLGA